MSILFPQVRKPREWDFRPRFYDPEKEQREQRRAKLQGERKQNEHLSGLHRGSFREAHEKNFQMKDKARSKSRIAFWLALLIMLGFLFYFFL